MLQTTAFSLVEVDKERDAGVQLGLERRRCVGECLGRRPRRPSRRPVEPPLPHQRRREAVVGLDDAVPARRAEVARLDVVLLATTTQEEVNCNTITGQL